MKVSKLMLRSLAYQATRNPDALLVLRDALEMTYPRELERAIHKAETWARSEKTVYAVGFDPAELTKQRMYSPSGLWPFHVIGGSSLDTEAKRRVYSRIPWPLTVFVHVSEPPRRSGQ